MVGASARDRAAMRGTTVELAGDRLHRSQRRRDGAARRAMLVTWISASALLGTLDRGHADEARTMKFKMVTEDGRSIAATLGDNPTARDFGSLLPLTLTLKDYASTEKISDLPKKLSTEGAPPGSDPSIGDITYYAPWGNLALFYKDFGFSQGLVKLGKIDSGVEALNRTGPLKVKFEVIKK